MHVGGRRVDVLFPQVISCILIIKNIPYGMPCSFLLRVWGKLVEALADVGYDSNSLVSMPYDWRLAMPLLQVRLCFIARGVYECPLCGPPSPDFPDLGSMHQSPLTK